MKHSVRRFKSLTVALKELEPFIRDGTHLQTGKPFARFGDMRSREILANWLLCAVMNKTDEDVYEFTSDPTGGDGVIANKRTGQTWPTEHVMVPNLPAANDQTVDQRVLKAVGDKNTKGDAAYAGGKTLVVFQNAAGGEWYPNKVVRQLPDPLHFAAVWVVGLQFVEKGEYVYGVTSLDSSHGNVPVCRVRIAADFGSWTVERIQ